MTDGSSLLPNFRLTVSNGNATMPMYEEVGEEDPAKTVRLEPYQGQHQDILLQNHGLDH